MLSSALRMLLLGAILMATAATSRQPVSYPKRGEAHQGSVYLHNARLEGTAVQVAGLEEEASVDCQALDGGSIDGLARDDFVFHRRWVISPGENLPLQDDRLEQVQRACHAALVRIGERDWLVHWRHGTPPSQAFAHTSQPGAPPTDGAVQVSRADGRWQLHPRSGVTARALDRRHILARDRRPPGMQEPGAVLADLRLSGRAIRGDATLGDADGLVTAGARWRMLFGERAGAATGLDFDLGTSNTGGFLVESNLYLLGAGLHGEIGMIGIAGGGGLSWASGGRMPFAWQLPVELFGSMKLTDHVRLGAWGRSQWVYDEDSRQDGSPSAPFGDELQAGLSLHWVALRFRDFGAGMGVSLTYTEQQGIEMWGISLGGGMWQTLD